MAHAGGGGQTSPIQNLAVIVLTKLLTILRGLDVNFVFVFIAKTEC